MIFDFDLDEENERLSITISNFDYDFEIFKNVFRKVKQRIEISLAVLINQSDVTRQFLTEEGVEFAYGNVPLDRATYSPTSDDIPTKKLVMGKIGLKTEHKCDNCGKMLEYKKACCGKVGYYAGSLICPACKNKSSVKVVDLSKIKYLDKNK